MTIYFNTILPVFCLPARGYTRAMICCRTRASEDWGRVQLTTTIAMCATHEISIVTFWLLHSARYEFHWHELATKQTCLASIPACFPMHGGWGIYVGVVPFHTYLLHSPRVGKQAGISGRPVCNFQYHFGIQTQLRK